MWLVSSDRLYQYCAKDLMQLSVETRLISPRFLLRGQARQMSSSCMFYQSAEMCGLISSQGVLEQTPPIGSAIFRF